MRLRSRIGLAALLLASAATVAAAADAAPKAKARVAAAPRTSIPAGAWRTIGRDLALSRFSPLTQINRSNVARLAPSWTYQLKSVNSAAPLVAGGVMYFPAGFRVVALDADSGNEVWVYTAQAGPPGNNGSGGGI